MQLDVHQCKGMVPIRLRERDREKEREREISEKVWVQFDLILYFDKSVA